MNVRGIELELTARASQILSGATLDPPRCRRWPEGTLTARPHLSSRRRPPSPLSAAKVVAHAAGRRTGGVRRPRAPRHRVPWEPSALWLAAVRRGLLLDLTRARSRAGRFRAVACVWRNRGRGECRCGPTGAITGLRWRVALGAPGDAAASQGDPPRWSSRRRAAEPSAGRRKERRTKGRVRGSRTEERSPRAASSES